MPTEPDGRVEVRSAGAPTTGVAGEPTGAGGAGEPTIVMVNVFCAVRLVEVSVTVTLKLENVPAAVGVPVMLLPLSASPAGRPVAVHVYVPDPPDAVRAAEYGVPTVPEDKFEVTITGGPAIVMENVCCPVNAEEVSVTVTMAEKVPGVVGVPPRLLPITDRPGGRPVADHVYAPDPPVAESDAE